MSTKRKAPINIDDRNKKRLDVDTSEELAEVKHITIGDARTFRHLSFRLLGETLPYKKELWVSPVEMKTMPKNKRYLNLHTIKVTGTPNILADRPRPPFMTQQRWSQEVGPGLLNSLLKINAGDCLDSGELSAMLAIIVGDQEPRVTVEERFGGLFEPPLNKFDAGICRKIVNHEAEFLLFGGKRPAEDLDSMTWYLMILDVKLRVLYFIDPSSSSPGLVKYQSTIFLRIKRLWEQEVHSNLFTLRKGINLPLAQQNDRLSSGLACIINANILFRGLERISNVIGEEDTSFEVCQTYIDGLMLSFERCIQLRVHSGWRRPATDHDKDSTHASPYLPRISFDKSLVTSALSVRQGRWENLTQLAESIHGMSQGMLNDEPIPCHSGPLRKIAGDVALYTPGTHRARELMAGRTPLDGSDAVYWNDVIGPNIANILLHMRQRSEPSGPEISAYLHMVLVDSFNGGERNPTVKIEPAFGDFLSKQTPKNHLWDLSVRESNPRFLIFGRRQPSVAHWYVIIVHTETRKAYCFDSTTQDNRAEHILAFAYLKEQWAMRFPNISAPGLMIELPSFLSNDVLSGFLCMYHVLILFRAPASRLVKLKGGDVDATKEDFDCVARAAEGYIGVKLSRSDHRKRENPISPEYKYDYGTRYSQVLDLNDRLPSITNPHARSEYIRQGHAFMPYRWPGDTYETLSKRPMPTFPSGWRGWADHKRKLAAVDAANKVTVEKPDREEQRRLLAEKRDRAKAMESH